MAATALDHRRLGCSLWDHNLDGQAAASITNKLELFIVKHGSVDVGTVMAPVWTVQDVLPPLIYFDDSASHHSDDGKKYR
jgi:hypothetical protein